VWGLLSLGASSSAGATAGTLGVIFLADLEKDIAQVLSSDNYLTPIDTFLIPSANFLTPPDIFLTPYDTFLTPCDTFLTTSNKLPLKLG
jgi:hypothetical protein